MEKLIEMKDHCPLCSGRAYLYVHTYPVSNNTRYSVGCETDSCFCKVDLSGFNHASQEEAREAWKNFVTAVRKWAY